MSATGNGEIALPPTNDLMLVDEVIEKLTHVAVFARAAIYEAHFCLLFFLLF
jgi:hypothetical protein